MTEHEIKELAYNCADEFYAKFGDAGSVTLMAGEYEDVIRSILKTHEITKRK